MGRGQGADDGELLGTAPDGRPMLLVERVEQWRSWLVANHRTETGVWLVAWRSITGRPRMTYDEGIDEALCVGWIDSHIRRMDDERTRLLFTPRKKGSVWSAPNKARVARLAAEGRLLPAGQAAVDRARSDGSWEALDAAERLEVPGDLAAALAAEPAAATSWGAFTPSTRKQILSWITTAKRPETRARRIAATVAEAKVGRRVNQPSRPRNARPTAEGP